MRNLRRKIVIAAAVVAMLAAIAYPPPAIFGFLKRIENKTIRMLGERLAVRDGIAFYSNLDERLPVCLPCGKTGAVFNCPRVPGKFGFGRRLGDNGYSTLTLHSLWNSGRSNTGAISFWLKPDSVNGRQRLWMVAKFAFGLEILDSKLVFCGTDGSNNCVNAECEFNHAGKFSNIIIAYDTEKLVIYVDGRECTRQRLNGGLLVPGKKCAFFVEVPFAFRGVIDDFAIWDRFVDSREAQRIASSGGRDLIHLYEPYFALFADLAKHISGIVSGSVRALDRLNPSGMCETLLSPAIRSVSVEMSKKDLRHFMLGHEESLSCGYRTRSSASLRRLTVSSGGASVKCEMMLDDVYNARHAAKRPSYIARGTAGVIIPGADIVRLIPPEEWGRLRPDAPEFFPTTVGQMRRLFINGDFCGIYCAVPFVRLGSGWLANGERNPHRTDMANFLCPPSRCAADAPDETKKVRTLILSDVRFPWSRSEVRYRISKWRNERKQLCFPPAGLSEFDLLGGNRAPFFITRDLDLRAAGAGCKWASSNPRFISDEGKVCRPGGDVPVVVEMLCRPQCGGTERTFRFRVMPEKYRLPVFMFSINTPLEKDRRTDFVCDFFPADGSAPKRMCGFVGNGSGIKHRGNTSYVRGRKRSVSVEFDEPPGLVGPSKADHVNFLCGYTDQTRLRNAMCYEIFSRMEATRKIPCRAPEIKWAEAFFNGSYYGVWELCSRIDENVLKNCDIFKVKVPSKLWFDENADMMHQIRPRIPGADVTGAIIAAAKFVKNSSTEDFFSAVDHIFDIDNIVDFLLLLNYSQNYDGRITNQFIARERGESGRIFFVPWDYDSTFFGKNIVWLGNHLTQRLWDEYPKFRKRMYDRWHELRADILDGKRIEEWIDTRAEMLTPYMDEEFKLQTPFPKQFNNYSDALRQFKESVAGSLESMDKYLEDKSQM